MVDQEYLFCCCHLWLSFVICNLWLWLLFYDMMERKENTVPTILTTDTVRTVEVKLCVSSGQGLVPTGTDSPIIRHPGIGVDDFSRHRVGNFGCSVWGRHFGWRVACLPDFLIILSGRVASKVAVTTSKWIYVCEQPYFEIHRRDESGVESAPMRVLLQGEATIAR